MTKKLITFAVAFAAVVAYARPHVGPGFRPGPRPPMQHRLPPPKAHHSHHSHYSWVGPVVGAVAGLTIGTSIAASQLPVVYHTSPVVLTQPAPIVTPAPVFVQPTIVQPQPVYHIPPPTDLGPAWIQTTPIIRKHDIYGRSYFVTY